MGRFSPKGGRLPLRRMCLLCAWGATGRGPRVCLVQGRDDVVVCIFLQGYMCISSPILAAYGKHWEYKGMIKV